MAFNNHHLHYSEAMIPEDTSGKPPTWLNEAILRQQSGVEGSSWENGKCKAEVIGHPLYEQLLSAHVACLRIATPVDQLPRIDAQLEQSERVVAKYSVLGGAAAHDKELDQFMTHYVLLLCSFKEQLQQHVRVHAMEAVMACWELEQSLQSLTGFPHADARKRWMFNAWQNKAPPPQFAKPCTDVSRIERRVQPREMVNA